MKQFRKYRIPFHDRRDPTHRSRAKRFKHINLFEAVRHLTDAVSPDIMIAWRCENRKADLEFSDRVPRRTQPWKEFIWR